MTILKNRSGVSPLLPVTSMKTEKVDLPISTAKRSRHISSLWSKCTHQPWRIIHKTNYIVNDKASLILLNSAFAQHQESYFGVKKYDGKQFNLTSSLYMDYYYGEKNHNLKVGISHRHNRLQEDISFTAPIPLLTYAGRYLTNYDIRRFCRE
ncbi:MAG: hypothetical protein IPO26_13700 [Saprospiraceae bacterium]|nr:hypothetical protein [Saprospiraceae bacterium]